MNKINRPLSDPLGHSLKNNDKGEKKKIEGDETILFRTAYKCPNDDYERIYQLKISKMAQIVQGLSISHVGSSNQLTASYNVRNRARQREQMKQKKKLTSVNAFYNLETL